MQVWLKHDLRMDDHPGFLHAAGTSSAIVPLFCVAPELYTHLLRIPYGVEGVACTCILRTCPIMSYTTTTLLAGNVPFIPTCVSHVFAGLLGALASLRGSLQSRGCDLVVRTGSLPGVVDELTQQVDASTIVAEEEVEHRCAPVLPHHFRTLVCLVCR
jgi:hypothetical protein